VQVQEKKAKEAPGMSADHLRQLIARRVTPAPPPQPVADPQQQQQPSNPNTSLPAAPAAAGEGAPQVPAEAAAQARKPAWKLIHKAVQQAVYVYLKEKLGVS
jgi:hypothetical protein